MNKAEYWIEELNLIKHPEGGYFNEVYRSNENVEMGNLPKRYKGSRSVATSIYFLLKSDDFSGFHRLQSDETWHFYMGTTLEIFVLGEDGKLFHHLLGRDSEAGECFQFTIPRNHWFGARIVDKNSHALLGCTVAPGFHFDDFEMAERERLVELFPLHESIIQELTIN